MAHRVTAARPVLVDPVVVHPVVAEHQGPAVHREPVVHPPVVPGQAHVQAEDRAARGEALAEADVET